MYFIEHVQYLLPHPIHTQIFIIFGTMVKGMKIERNRYNRMQWVTLFITPLIPALLFILYVGYYNFLEYNSYRYTQFDLGVNFRTLYNFHVYYHLYNWPNPLIETPQTFSKLIYIPLSFTLYVYNSPVTLLVDQILCISVGGIAVFSISKKVLGDFWSSLFVEIVYFLYPATYGFMTQGGNFMIFFEPFLLIGYYYYIRRKWVRTIIFLSLASISNPLAPLIILTTIAIPYLTRVVEFIIGKISTSEGLKTNYSLRFSNGWVWQLLIFLIPLLVFALSLKLYGIDTLYGAARLGSISTVTSSGSILHSLTENFGQKISFLNDVFQPLLYLPLMSAYAIPILIYLLIAWYSNQIIYYDMLPRQYPYLFAGVVFISLVYAVKRLKVNPKTMKKIAVLIIVSSTVSFALYSPFSIGNFQSGAVANNSTITPLEKKLTSAFELIPMNSSVLTQNDIVQLMNRQEVYFPGYYNNETVQYAVFAPPGQYGIQNSYAGFSSVLGDKFASNASYGMYVRLGNVEIYKLDYTGLPVMFSQENFTGTSSFYKDVAASYTNIAFSTGFITLSPGYYNISFKGAVNTSTFLSSGSILGNVVLLGADGMSSNSTTIFSVSLSSGNIIFRGHIYIKNFDSYAINVHFNHEPRKSLTYVGSPYYYLKSTLTDN